MSSPAAVACPTNVLVVEDDPDIRASIRDALEDEGYCVTTATNGKEGLAAFATLPRPCLVLLDIMMPVMNGLEFLEVMQKSDILAPIPVVVVSAYTDLAKKAQGTVGFVKKPIHLEMLLQVVAHYCNHKG